MTRPQGSNADEWHLFLSEHKDALPFVAVQIAEAIEALEKKVLTPHERERLEIAGKMLAIYGDDCFPPPNEMGQRHFGAIVMESAAKSILSIFYPLFELCAHVIDEQAGCCIKCHANVEEIT